MQTHGNSEGAPGILIDSHDRRIDYLRISVTDRCNLRCVYCMPPAGIQWQPHEFILSYEEIVTVARAALQIGITRFRLTGGEPLVRPGVVNLVAALAALPGVQDLSLTTNGTLLAGLARPLAEAGLRRINVSLDTLDPAKFRRLTRWGEIDRVWEGIRAAEEAGLAPIKINAVVVRGVNDDELCDMARLTLTHPWQVRFIELMPVANAGEWGTGFPSADGRQVLVQEMQTRLANLGLRPVETLTVGCGPARTFTIAGGIGSVGFISPLGEHFCACCNRLRLTADGRLRPCLLSECEISVRDALRDGREVGPLIRRAAGLKPATHQAFPTGTGAPQDRTMCQIGG